MTFLNDPADQEHAARIAQIDQRLASECHGNCLRDDCPACELAAQQAMLDRWDREDLAMIILTSEALLDRDLFGRPDDPLIIYVDFSALDEVADEFK